MSDQVGDEAYRHAEPFGGVAVNIQHLASAIDAPLVVIDRSLQIVFVGPVAEELFGRAADELIGTPLRSLLAGCFVRHGSPVIAAVERCMATGEIQSATTTLQTLRGPSRARLTMVPSPSDGQATGAILFFNIIDGGEMARYEDPKERLPWEAPETIEVDDLHAALDRELPHVVEVLDLDFAIAQLFYSGGCFVMIYHGIEPGGARELLESTGPDGIPLDQAVMEAGTIISDIDSCDIHPLPGDITSFAAFSLRERPRSRGCIVFGRRGEAPSVRQYSRILQVLCSQINISLRNHALNMERKRRNTQLHGLYEASKAVSRSLDLNEVLHTIIDVAMSLVDAENCFLFEVDHEQGKLRILTMKTRYAFDPTIELDIGEGLVGMVAFTGKGILAPRADLDPWTKYLMNPPDTPSSMIVVPLVFNDQVLGVMSLEKTPGVPFDHSQYELIETFSVQAAMAINNAQMFGDLKRTASTLQMFNVLLTHDVANFNSPIHSYLEMLLREPTLDERQLRYVRSALVQSDNISEMIADVRQMLAMRSNEKGWSLESTDLVKVIGEAIGDISSNAVYEDIEMMFQPSVERALVLGNSFLKGFFYNILSNACKYGNGRPVSIGLEGCDEGGAWWKVFVEDRGRGIPDERKARLFKRFDQLSTSHAAEGHGIGLSVVAELVRRYGGQVWAEDRVPGDHTQGARFTVLLPRYEPSDLLEV